MRRSQRTKNAVVAQEEKLLEQASLPRSSQMSQDQAPTSLEKSKGVGLGNNKPTKKDKIAAARQRYSRLTEHEPEHHSLPLPYDLEEEERKTKKNRLEAQRNKYHAMTPEQRREYNAKRTELGRKRRREEDQILARAERATGPPELLAKAELIRAKRKKNAERAKRRYDSMTQAEKRKHNTGRSVARRVRTVGSRDSYLEPYDESSNDWSMQGPPDSHNEDDDGNDEDYFSEDE
ncbi:unnamed protein product [Caenorhabditis brenneri]